MSWPAMVLWAMVIPTMLFNGPVLLYVLSIVGVFGSLQMLPDGGKGANLLPATLFAVAFVVRAALGRGNVLRGLESALDPARLGLLTAFMVYAVLTALLLPRLFAGIVEVVPITGAALSGTSLLQPRSGNITQTGYMMISYLTALSFSVIGSRVDVRYHYGQALLWGGIALVVTGVLDLALYRVGLSSVLDPFRTADYALLTDVEAAGAKRVVGLTPEASAYGTLCITISSGILFLRPLYPAGGRRVIATLAILSLAVMAALSLSTTAFAGGAVLACLYAFDLCHRYFDRSALGRDSLGWEIGALFGIAGVGLAVLLLVPEGTARLPEVLDKVVFAKTTSLSYYQRSMWTHVGWQAFLDSGGLGVGFGSVRTSNWVVAILASTGVFGSLLLFGLLFQKLTSSTRHSTAREVAFSRALKLTLLPALAMGALAGTTPDIGIGMAAMIGLLSRAPLATREVGAPTPLRAGAVFSGRSMEAREKPRAVA